MKKLITLLLAVALVGCCSFSVGALGEGNPFQIISNSGTTYKVKGYSTIGAALTAAASGHLDVDLVRNASTANQQTISTRILLNTTYEGYTFNQSKKRSPMTLTYTGTKGSLFTVANGGYLILDNINIVGNTNTSVQKGGLIYVQNGGALYLRCSDVTLKDSVLNAANSCGGAIYAEAGAVVNILGVTYSGNHAATDDNIHFESGAICRYVDLNNDGACDVRDLVRLKRYLADKQVAVFGTPDFNADTLEDANDILAYRAFLFTA